MKKIAFVLSEPRLHEQFSIMSLSASLKRSGHATSLVYFQDDPLNRRKILDALEKDSPDIVALSFMSTDKDHYLSLARAIKDRMRVTLLAGGPGVTFDARLQSAQDSPFDALCLGEGDRAFVDFVNGSGRNNFITPGSGEPPELLDLIDPMDQLPFADRGIVYDRDDFLRNSKIKMFISGRGCPYLCTYCFNHKFNEMYRGRGRVIRHKSVDYFLEEIRQVMSDYPMEGIIFEDDIFIIDKPWFSEFCEKYPGRIGLPYTCYVRPNLVTQETARLLKVSGCYSARVAIECGNAGLRNKVLKRYLYDSQILNACRMLREQGIKVGTINILGLPTETVDHLEETLALNIACRPDHVSANLFMPIPGVELTDYARRLGLLDEDSKVQKSTHTAGDLKYPLQVQKVLYPFKALFPVLVEVPCLRKIRGPLEKLPLAFLKLIEKTFRLLSHACFYPPCHLSLADKWRAVRRYALLNSR